MNTKLASSALNMLKTSKVGVITQQNSPAILMGVGFVGFIGTVVLASKATVRVVNEVVPDHSLEMTLIDKEHERAMEEDISEEDKKEETKEYNIARYKTLAKTAGVVTKEYAPAVIVGGGTVACFLGAYNILQTRNAALTAAYTLVHAAFGEYRQRVRDEMGEVYDHHYRYGTPLIEETETVVDKETGKKKKVKRMKVDGTAKVELPDVSMYSKLFCEFEYPHGVGPVIGSRAFMSNHQMNYIMLQSTENRCNDRLRVDGFLYLNDVYDILGLARTKAGQVVGWMYKGEEDEGVRFMDTVDLYSYSDGDPILLDFNVQGVIVDSVPSEEV